MAVLVFDVYGTLIDTSSIEPVLRKVFGDDAGRASDLWRSKQVEYSFRRALMRKYVDFSVCTEQALLFVSAKLGQPLTEERKRELLSRYLHLEPFPDVAAGLGELAKQGNPMIAFSNGTEKTIRAVLEQAGLLGWFREVVSVDDVRSYKPSPAAYAHLTDRLGVAKDEIWLVSSNSFDVIGAKAYGLKTAWVRRDPAVPFDPWEFSPDAVVESLTMPSFNLGASFGGALR